MPGRQNPLATRFIPDIPLAATRHEENEIITRLEQEILTADDARVEWLERQKMLSRLRYGIRPRVKTFPFKGASNLAIPLIDSSIRKSKPTFMRLLVEPDPVVEFVGDDPQAVDAERDAEEMYNWIFKTEMDALEPMAYIIDSHHHRGCGFAQVGWQYRTELEVRTVNVQEILQGQQVTDPQQLVQLIAQQYDVDLSDPRAVRSVVQAAEAIAQGAPYVKVAHRKVIHDRPAIWDRDPVQIIMPARETSVEDAQWIVVQHVLHIRKLEQLEADGFFRPGAVKEIKAHLNEGRSARIDGGGDGSSHLDLTPSARTLREIEDRRTQVFGADDENNIMVWEVYHWHDHDGDGLADRVVTWLHPRSKVRLSTRPYLFPFPEWPFVKFDFEKTSRRWFAPRGISSMLEGIQRETNAQHNARIDAMTIRNAPSYQISAVAGFKAQNFRVIPGTVLQTPAGSRLEPLLQDRSAFPEQVSEEQQLRAIAENYIGTFDTALSDPLNIKSARTATEIQAAAQFASSVASFDTILFQLAMRKVHEKVWKLWLDLGPSETHIKVVGDNGQPTSKLIRKSDIDRSFKLIPTGTIANTNRALELAHAREALQLYLNDQTGFINSFELRRWHIGLLAHRQARRILNSPEQAQELQTLRAAAAELQKNPELQAQVAGEVFDVPPEEVDRQETEQLPRQDPTRF